MTVNIRIIVFLIMCERTTSFDCMSTSFSSGHACSRRILWEQIGQLREEMHNIQYQLSKLAYSHQAEL